MTTPHIRVWAWTGAALLGLGGSTWAAAAPAAGTQAGTPDIAGTYELVKRVLPDGQEIVPPAIGGLYTLSHGHRNFNVFWTDKDGKAVSLSIVSTYVLAGGRYCEKSAFWLQNNLDKPGTSNAAPVAAKECRPVTIRDGAISFQPAGEPALTFNKEGLTATNAGRFVDYWKKLRLSDNNDGGETTADRPAIWRSTPGATGLGARGH